MLGHYDGILPSGALGRVEYGLFSFADQIGAVVQVIGVEDHDFALADTRPTMKSG